MRIPETIIAILFILAVCARPAAALSAGSELVREPENQHRSRPLQKSAAVTAGGQTALARIGVYLPLSGPFAGFGQELRRGLELARESPAGDESEAPELIYVDSESNRPEAAFMIFRQRDVQAVLGPMRSKLARESASLAAGAQLPIILWAPQPELTRQSPYVFQFFLSAAGQARALSGELEAAGIKQAAVLYPDNDFGRDFFQALRESAGSKSIITSPAVAYQPTAADFSPDIRSLLAADPQSGEQEPVYPFEALVLADFYPRLRLLLPQLRFHGLHNCKLLLTAEGRDPRLAPEFENDFPGVKAVDLCWRGQQQSSEAMDFSRLFLDKFQEKFQGKFQEKAGIYAVFAYDSLLIIQQAASQPKARNLVEGLMKPPPKNLLCGPVSVNQYGEFMPRLCLYNLK